MKNIILCCLIAVTNCIAQQDSTKIIYLIPGTGSDGRLFERLDSEHETAVIQYLVPEKGMNMSEYAQLLTQQIDTSRRFSIIGVSLGGMLAVEMSKFLQAEEVILVSSAKTRHELPYKYRFFRYAPLHRVLGGRFYKFCTLLFQPIYEPLTKEDEIIWQAMLKEKPPKFIKRVIRCMVEWDNETYNSALVTHIHGTKDKTLPIKHVENAIVIEDGTHIMMLDRATELSEIIKDTIK